MFGKLSKRRSLSVATVGAVVALVLVLVVALQFALPSDGPAQFEHAYGDAWCRSCPGCSAATR
jgi:hypothetical protein